MPRISSARILSLHTFMSISILRSYCNTRISRSVRGLMPSRLPLTCMRTLSFRFGQKALDEPGIEFPGPKVRIGKNLPVQRNRGEYALDDKHLERPSHARDCLVAVLSAHN